MNIFENDLRLTMFVTMDAKDIKERLSYVPTAHCSIKKNSPVTGGTKWIVGRLLIITGPYFHILFQIEFPHRDAMFSFSAIDYT